MLQNKKQATIVDCFLREGNLTPGYPIRPNVKLACKWRWGIKNSATAEGFLREGYTTPGYSIRPLVKLA
jgi:hypothetical protein